MYIHYQQDDFNKYVTFFGRHKKTNNGVAFYYTASGFSFKVKGTKVSLVFNSYYEEENKKAYLVITHDSKEDVFELQLGKTEINLQIENESVIHVYKRSESMMSRSELVSLITDEEFLENSNTSQGLKMTFIGDSLTCGYGNLSHKTDIPFSTEYEDGLKSFASLTGRMMKARFEVVSVSGMGLYKSIYANVTMPSIYEQYDIYDTEKYPFQGDEDIVVLNLGTNDNSYLKFLVEPTRLYEEQMFKKAYLSFVQRLIALHPKAAIVCISQGVRQEYVDQLIVEAVKEINLPSVIHFRTSDIQENDGMGQQFHPTVLTHERWANELKEQLIKLMKARSL